MEKTIKHRTERKHVLIQKHRPYMSKQTHYHVQLMTCDLAGLQATLHSTPHEPHKQLQPIISNTSSRKTGHKYPLTHVKRSIKFHLCHKYTCVIVLIWHATHRLKHCIVFASNGHIIIISTFIGPAEWTQEKQREENLGSAASALIAFFFLV